MNFNLPEELQMLRDMVRDFATEKIAPFANDWDEKHYFPYEEAVKPMGELGLFGTVIPEEYGGSGMGWLAAMIVTEEMVRLMSPGSVVVDIAAEAGGNCEPTRPGQTVEVGGVSVHGAVELPSQLPQHTSQMYSSNVLNAFHNLFAGEDDGVDLSDEINRNALVSYRGGLVCDAVKAALDGGSASE